ncbi:MAG: GNAT family N-acetyltransferase [Lachnospiraceae bacterium]|nr:GNAT family N-acetyltransferase [Lachnospiraceae bacterium]MDO4318780.1 GNAT family N-acetyltransferase [Lachnospiraceae bacterium]
MKMVFPGLGYKEKAIEYIKEFYTYGSEISGSGSLDRFLRESTYERWLEQLVKNMDIANLPETMAPSLTYFYVREEDDKIIGMINIRLALNEFLRKEAGHIGYSVRPTERRKQYATAMLREGLRVCGIMGIEDVIVSCDKSNIASAKVIQNCGGELDAEFYSETFRETLQRYVIKRKNENSAPTVG